VHILLGIIFVLLIGALVLGIESVSEMKRRINENFNSQQLELARHAAGITTENFKILKRELLTLSLSPSIQYLEEVSWLTRMERSFSSVSDYGLIKITFISAAGDEAFSFNYMGSSLIDKNSYSHEEYFKWCKKPKNKGSIFISEAKAGLVEYSDPGIIMIMATPVYQVSRDEAYPVPTGEFSGVLLFILDASLLAKKIVGPIQSGKTGYAWVIDESGNFMYHQERDFIGQNAFEVRKFKDPHISFSKINLIQKTMMLEGEEGTSWYISGWHRGETGAVKKLIAYSPVHIGFANKIRRWSVAVVAPISEVNDAIHTVYIRQAMIQGSFTAAVVIIFLFLMMYERTWLKTLEKEVKEKTIDIERYADKLKRSEESYRSLIESADDMIYTMDKECNILSINRYFADLVEQRDEKIVGQNIRFFIEYIDPNDVGEVLKKVIEKSETIGVEESLRIGTREYLFDTKYKPIMINEGEVSTVLVISRDITEHKRIEEQLFHTEKLASLGSLSAGVAHEMNNPVGIILGFSELLLEKFPADSKEYNMLKTIERQATNCQRIVENLLTFARIPEKAAIDTDIVDDIQKVVNMVTNTMLTKKVDFKKEIAEGLPRVRGDGQQLEQVFLNIINNAVAAMGDDGGILTISAKRSNNMVSIRFTDTGPGISLENRDKIFEPFFTTKKVGEGTGLGLSVSYAIVSKFGGDIRVESETSAASGGPGTTFTVLLPVSETEKQKREIV
jgi:PAS domain S-box-containing protein